MNIIIIIITNSLNIIILLTVYFAISAQPLYWYLAECVRYIVIPKGGYHHTLVSPYILVVSPSVTFTN